MIESRIKQSDSIVGHYPKPHFKENICRQYVLVLPNIKEFLTLVLAQAIAYSYLFIASSSIGSVNLFTDGEEEFITVPRNFEEQTKRLRCLAGLPHEWEDGVARAILLGKSLGAKDDCGQNYIAMFQKICFMTATVINATDVNKMTYKASSNTNVK